MKHIFLLLILLLFSCSSSKKAQTSYIPPIHFAGELGEAEVQFMKANYAWTSGNLLIINFIQPRSYCHFDNYKINRDTLQWQKKFYLKLNSKQVSNIFVFSDAERVKGHFNRTNYFEDRENFLLNNYFSRERSCFGVMVINETGEYLQYNGHYSIKQVNAFIEALSDAPAAISG